MDLDSNRRESRVIVLLGPSSAGKSSLIDFMCNFFYGAQFLSPIRYRIANEVSPLEGSSLESWH